MPMYSLIEYSDNYSKTLGSLRQYYGDQSNDNITESEPFKSKIEITGKLPDVRNTKNVELSVPLKYFINFWRTLKISLINCELSLILTWSKNRATSSATEATEFVITDTKRCVPVVTLSTENNIKQWNELESGFKRTVNQNKCQPKLTDQEQNRYFDYLINPRFQRVNRLFVLLFENRTDNKVRIKY